MNIAFGDMNPFPMRQIQNRRAFHLEKVRLELTELEAIRQTFLRERETSQDRRSFVSDDEEENWTLAFLDFTPFLLYIDAFVNFEDKESISSLRWTWKLLDLVSASELDLRTQWHHISIPAISFVYLSAAAVFSCFDLLKKQSLNQYF